MADIPPKDIKDIRQLPSSGPFMIQIKYFAAPMRGDVKMQIIAPEVAQPHEIADMLRQAAAMCDPMVAEGINTVRARKDRIWSFLKKIGSTMRAPPPDKFN